jgi:uncharacterized membrane protein
MSTTPRPSAPSATPAFSPSPGRADPLAGGEPVPAGSVFGRRVDAVDMLRGLVMVFMLIDHTRDFAHVDALKFDPTNLARTTVPLFFTRWITHFCAPVFVFLAGTGAYLQRIRGRSDGELARYLVTRGLWLIVLEFTVVRFGYAFNFDYAMVGMLQVIWVIGVSMIVLAALLRLPTPLVGALGVATIALHNLLDGVRVRPWAGPASPPMPAVDKLWMVLHQPGPMPVAGSAGPIALVLYPVIPWVGVLLAGFTFGMVYRMEPARRQRLLLRLGAVITVLFVALRLLNVYGEPSRWSPQPTAVFTVLSFLATSKYPPSLLYLLMTLGPSIALLALFERRMERGTAGAPARALTTFGRVPLFYYLLQWPVSHGLAVLAGLVAGQPVAYQFFDPFSKPNPLPPNIGFSLPVVYLLWAIGLVILYPLFHRRSLRSAVPTHTGRGKDGLTTFRWRDNDQVRRSLSAGSVGCPWQRNRKPLRPLRCLVGSGPKAA